MLDADRELDPKRWRPLHTIKVRPVTSVLLLMMSIWMIWTGVVLLHYQLPPSPPSKPQYVGPREFWGLHTWGLCFIGGGMVKLTRILLQQFRALSTILHILSMSIIVGWAISFDLGPLSTAQPSYTFVAAVCLFLPFITDLIVNSGEVEVMHDRLMHVLKTGH